MRFEGSYVALVTPWTKDLGGIDYAVLKDLVEWHVASGTDGILPAGTTGESPTLTHDEQVGLIEKIVEYVNGRCKVLAGAGSNNTNESLFFANAAKSAGADAILVITPYYNRPTPEGLYQHFAAVAKSCPELPIMVYNVPGRTGTNMLPQTIARVNRDFPQVCAVKEASGSVDQAGQIISMTKMDVMSGDDSLTVPIMSIGGTGIVSVIANIAPVETKAMAAAALAGDFVKAREWHHRLLPLMKACFIETNPGPVKAAMQMLGRCSAAMRLPMVSPTAESETVIREAMRKAGIVQ